MRLNFPIGMNAGLAKALGVMMKLDFERAVLNRVPEMEAHPERYFRQVLFLCDEYQHFATVGESDPTGDEKFFSLSSQPKCIPIVATQSISSLRSALPGESWRTLLQTFRTKIFLTLSDDFSASTASHLCGREDQLKVAYSLSESGHDTKVSWLTGKALSHKANIIASKSYNTQSDYRFDMKTFMELRNAQSITVAYDGLNPIPPPVLLLEAVLQRPERVVFRPARERKTLMNGFEVILPFLKPIEHLILDDSISEVMVNGTDRVFIEKQGFLQQVPGVSIGDRSLMVAIKNIARRLGDDISESKPILDSRLPDGSRVAAVIPPCSLGGVTLTIRKFNTRHFEMEDLIREGTLDRALANHLEDYVLARKNVLICWWNRHWKIDPAFQSSENSFRRTNECSLSKTRPSFNCLSKISFALKHAGSRMAFRQWPSAIS